MISEYLLNSVAPQQKPLKKVTLDQERVLIYRVLSHFLVRIGFFVCVCVVFFSVWNTEGENMHKHGVRGVEERER